MPQGAFNDLVLMSLLFRAVRRPWATHTDTSSMFTAPEVTTRSVCVCVFRCYRQNHLLQSFIIPNYTSSHYINTLSAYLSSFSFSISEFDINLIYVVILTITEKDVCVLSLSTSPAGSQHDLNK